MRVTLTRAGGIAAGIRRPALVVSTAALSPTNAAELSRLVAEAKLAPVPPADPPGRARDAMSYTIIVENGSPPTQLRCSDANMTPALAALLSWLERHHRAT
jgi:hypothetical protein